MNIETKYWKSDKVIPSEIFSEIKHISDSSIADMCYANFPDARRIERTDKGITINFSKRFLVGGPEPMQHDDATIDDLWADALVNQDLASMLVDALTNNNVAYNKRIGIGTSHIIESFIEYMGIIRDAKRLSGGEDFDWPPHTRSGMRWRDDIWERLENDE
tara:strand:- start:1481 stop:1963 length:483 start_codon:yes stop_codon:yes gene_type:complete